MFTNNKLRKLALTMEDDLDNINKKIKHYIDKYDYSSLLDDTKEAIRINTKLEVLDKCINNDEKYNDIQKRLCYLMDTLSDSNHDENTIIKTKAEITILRVISA